jgi:hypothetical protein
VEEVVVVVVVVLALAFNDDVGDEERGPRSCSRGSLFFPTYLPRQKTHC